MRQHAGNCKKRPKENQDLQTFKKAKKISDPDNFLFTQKNLSENRSNLLQNMLHKCCMHCGILFSSGSLLSHIKYCEKRPKENQNMQMQKILLFGNQKY